MGFGLPHGVLLQASLTMISPNLYGRCLIIVP